ncbi:MAG: GNAT family N-acetyltransferase [Candidatus Altiarchaeales archaeon]|nr:GNAT family N-acetyltransferase [Candidatus Altiarchaeales archaeon]MBD3417124.1 GNAT family N-acetyltransferase [Candidatus Altiarchaeales archaeon]
MEFNVRFFEHRDVAGVLALYQSVGFWFEEVEVNEEFIISSSQRPDFRFIVAEDGGNLLGFIGALYFSEVGRAELGPLGVDVDFHGTGVAKSLVERMLAFLGDNGIHRLTVKVKSGNKRAQRFFLKHGFSTEAYLRRYTLKGEDVVQMVHYLKKPKI